MLQVCDISAAQRGADAADAAAAAQTAIASSSDSFQTIQKGFPDSLSASDGGGQPGNEGQRITGSKPEPEVCILRSTRYLSSVENQYFLTRKSEISGSQPELGGLMIYMLLISLTNNNC